MSIHIFGIRHHGPGCARSLSLALQALQPDIVLVEGPSDVKDVLPLLIHPDMHPPVALLVYAPDKPQLAAYYPFTSFSPEWQALSYALQHAIPARFIDLPQSIQLARRAQDTTDTTATPQDDPPPEVANNRTQTTTTSTPTKEDEPAAQQLSQKVRTDPIALLATAAGYTDSDLWWEQQIEQRRDMTDLFASILEAMSALRADAPAEDEEEALREAHMRQEIRAAQKEGFQRIAIICGAWHAPALESSTASTDTALLKHCTRIKVSTTWIPWTNSRLSARSGYGAGISSPGWYEHLWTHSDQISTRWLTRAAHLLREQGLDASSANIIEAVRLSDALAAMRSLSMPGLAELTESIETVLCHGDVAPMTLIRERLEIGERLGQVPAETPAVPLQRHLEERQRVLRLKPSAEQKRLELDLRNETDLGRSQLLHQLRLLNIHWATPEVRRGQQSTFHEDWLLQWRVDFAVSLIEANIWGNTVAAAATAFVHHQADALAVLPQLTELLDSTILAALPDAVDYLLSKIQQRAAVSADIRHIMDALLPLARVARYSNVRQTRSEQVLPVINGLFERVLIGLPGACSSLDEDAAQLMVASIDHMHESVQLLHDPQQREEWQRSLRLLAERESIHGFVRGRSCRLLLEQNVLDDDTFQRLTRLALSLATPANQSAAWIEGVLRGSGLVMLHQDNLWRALDSWLRDLSPDTFDALLPILRRAFANFQSPERRKMGEKVKYLHHSTAQLSSNNAAVSHHTESLNTERAQKVLPILAQLLGVKNHVN